MSAIAYDTAWLFQAGRRPRAVARLRLDRLQRHFSLKRVIAAGIMLAIVLFGLGWASRENPAEKPLLQIQGGGFIFNYRVSDVFYGFTAIVNKPLAIGSIVEATFDNPANGAPIVISKRVDARSNRYTFRTPPLRGVVAHTPYHVTIRVYDRQKKDMIWKTERDYRSEISDTVVPDRPLTIGPGYTLNPRN